MITTLGDDGDAFLPTRFPADELAIAALGVLAAGPIADALPGLPGPSTGHSREGMEPHHAGPHRISAIFRHAARLWAHLRVQGRR